MKITEVRAFGMDMWEVIIERPNGHRYHSIKSKRDHPDELSAYTAVLLDLEKEQTNGRR